ncbi:hypothetical protein V1503_24380 [Bacillus sp. SCS-151]|uniref:hypothetical protein n=1 Tax=Nanhaiella sioensis TaxID=3115293 RepID=UPI00397CBCAA
MSNGIQLIINTYDEYGRDSGIKLTGLITDGNISDKEVFKSINWLLNVYQLRDTLINNFFLKNEQPEIVIHQYGANLKYRLASLIIFRQLMSRLVLVLQKLKFGTFSYFT